MEQPEHTSSPWSGLGPLGLGLLALLIGVANLNEGGTAS